MIAAIGKFLGGSGGMALLAFIAGSVVGVWGAGVWNDASWGKQYRVVAVQSSKALVTLVQNAGRREMNYLWNGQAERQQCLVTIDALENWKTLSAQAQVEADAIAQRLKGQLKASAARYDELARSYENADKTTTGWLNADLPADLCIVRYGSAACRTDPFAAAGYPEPPARPPAVAQPPR